MLSSVRSGLVCSATPKAYVVKGPAPRNSGVRRFAELPVPGLLAAAALIGPGRMDPAENRGMGQHPLVLRGAEVVDAAAQVDRDTPPVVRRTGKGGQRRLAAVQIDLRG